MRVPKMDLDPAFLVCYTDSSMANNDDLTSQISAALVLRYNFNHAVILHACSRKYKRVTNSILAGETIACVTGFDIAFMARHSLNELMGRKVELFLMHDSYSLFSTITKCSMVREKSLMIDIAVMRESYEGKAVYNIGFVRTEHNLANLTLSLRRWRARIWRLCAQPASWTTR